MSFTMRKEHLFFAAMTILYIVTAWLAWNAGNVDYKINDAPTTIGTVSLLLVVLYSLPIGARRAHPDKTRHVGKLLGKSILACLVTFLVLLPLLFYVTTSITDQIIRKPTYSASTDGKGPFTNAEGKFICRMYQYCVILEGCDRGFTHSCSGAQFIENKTTYAAEAYGRNILGKAGWVTLGVVTFFEDMRSLQFVLLLLYPFLAFFSLKPQTRWYGKK